MADEIHLGNVGTMFKTTIVSSGSPVTELATATTKQIIFSRPDGVRIVKDASFYTDGSDGILTYTTIADDLSLAGLWRIQGYVEIPDLGEFYSNVKTFTVYGNL